MKKFIALILALAVACCAPSVFAFDWDSAFFSDLFNTATDVPSDNDNILPDASQLSSVYPPVDSAMIFDCYCSSCGRVTSCENCSAGRYTAYEFYDSDCHLTTYYYEIVCTQCNYRWGQYYYYDAVEPHVWDQNDACILCGW